MLCVYNVHAILVWLDAFPTLPEGPEWSQDSVNMYGVHNLWLKVLIPQSLP